MKERFALVAVLVIVGTACASPDSDENADGAATPTSQVGDQDCARITAPAPITAPLAEPSIDAAVTLTPMGVSIDTPTALAAVPDSDDMLVTERAGAIRRMTATDDGFTLDPEPVLDLTADVGPTEGEHGLLGIAYDPAGARLYVDYTEASAGDIVVESFAVDADGRPDPSERQEVLHLDPRCEAHLGGHLLFEGNGELLIGVGDGDGGRIANPSGSSQDRTNLFGSILRITPTPDGPEPYVLPDDNPFASQGDGARGEILVQGVRNPWRFDLDPDTGDLWVADVGEDAFEEVTRVDADAVAGVNLGWDHKEASRPFRNVESTPDDVVDPQYEYDRDHGCSITGGVVVDEAGLPGYGGGFVFGDLCTGRLEIARAVEDGGVEVEELGVTVPAVVTFGQDRDGNVYAVSFTGAVSRLDPAR